MIKKATPAKKTVKKTVTAKKAMCKCPGPCAVCKPAKKIVHKTVKKAVVKKAVVKTVKKAK